MVEFKEIVVECTLGFWCLQIAQNLVYLLACYATIRKLRPDMLWNNYLAVAFFNACFLGRSVMYSVLFWLRTDRGTLEVTIPPNGAIEGDVAVLYRMRLFDGIADFTVVAVFFYIVLKMSHLWDRLYFDRLLTSIWPEIEASPGSSTDRHDREVMLAEQVQRLALRQTLRLAFMAIFAAANVAMLIAEILYLTVAESKV